MHSAGGLFGGPLDGLRAWLSLVCVVLLVAVWVPSADAVQSSFTVGVVWPITAAPGLLASFNQGRAAIYMAIDDLNSNHWNILPNTTWSSLWQDDQNTVTKTFFKTLDLCNYCTGSLATGHCQVDFITGPVSSDEMTSAIPVSREFYVPLITGTSTSSAFSDKKKYPTFARVIPPDSQQCNAMIRVVTYFNWTEVAIVNSDSDIGTSTAAAFLPLAKANNVTVVNVAQFPSGSSIDIPAALESTRLSGARIIFLACITGDATLLMTAAQSLNMTGYPYVWLGLSAWLNNATPLSIWAAVDGAIGIQPRIDSSTAEWRYFRSKWSQWYGLTANHNYTYNITTPTAPFAFMSYDAVMLAARAYAEMYRFNDTCTAAGNWTASDMNDVDKARCTAIKAGGTKLTDAYLAILSEVEFAGVSGWITRDANGDRIGFFTVNNFRRGALVAVGVCNLLNGTLDINNTDVQWPDGSNNIPRDGPITIYTLSVIGMQNVNAIRALASIGVTYAATCLGLNVALRRKKLIKMSSPNINSLGVFGAAVVYIGLFFMGNSTTAGSVDEYERACNARLWLFATGFTLAFGSLFSKTYRVNHIFKKQAKLKTVKIPDSKLFMVVVMMLCVDVIILGAWSGYQPLVRVTHYSSPAYVDLDHSLITVTESCYAENFSLWLGVLLAYKGVLLMFGSWLAFEVRNVEIKTLNDSYLIGIAIYTTTVVMALLIPITLVVTDQSTNFWFSCIIVWLLTTAYLSIVFMPKIVAIARGMDVDELTHTVANQTLVNNRRGSRPSVGVSSNDVNEHGQTTQTNAFVDIGHPNGDNRALPGSVGGGTDRENRDNNNNNNNRDNRGDRSDRGAGKPYSTGNASRHVRASTGGDDTEILVVGAVNGDQDSKGPPPPA